MKMNLKTDIEQIFSNNTNYTNPSQAVNQASSLNALSGDLYTDSKRFIYELLQNADDSSQQGEPIKVWIKTFDENFSYQLTQGKPFTSRDLQGICNVNNGTKKSDFTKQVIKVSVLNRFLDNLIKLQFIQKMNISDLILPILLNGNGQSQRLFGKKIMIEHSSSLGK